MNKSQLKNALLLLLIIIAAVLFRIFVASGNNIPFWYDQGRDFSIARRIIDGDWVIFGPRVSGTNDTLYHGVLYYYLIAPLVKIFSTNIQYVSFFLGGISSLGVLSIYLLAKKLSRSTKYGLLSALLYAISFEAAQMGTWLSNPTIAIFTLPLFYLLLWVTFFEMRLFYLPLLTFVLGINNQATAHTVYLWFSVLVAYWYASNKRKVAIKIPVKNMVISIAAYFLSVSTMVIVQLRLLLNGIFPSFETFVGQPHMSDKLRMWTNLFGSQIGWTYTPVFPLLSITVSLFVFWWLAGKAKRGVCAFFLIWLLAPLSLLSLQERQNYHFIIGLSPAFLLLLTLFFKYVSKQIFGRLFVVVGLLVYLSTNVMAVYQIRRDKIHISNNESLGALLTDQYRLIDRTYNLAKGRPFTVSMITAPYGLYSSWFYLYKWYGEPKYGYLPQYIGYDQRGIAAGSYLNRTDHPGRYHFSIYEPIVVGTMPEHLTNRFVELQNTQAGDIVQEKEEFGNLHLEVRQPVNNAK